MNSMLPMQDNFVKRSLKRIREQISENSMWVDGEFVSEAYMKEELKLSPFSAPQLIRPEMLPHGNLTCLHFLSMLNQMTSQGPNQKHKGQM